MTEPPTAIPTHAPTSTPTPTPTPIPTHTPTPTPLYGGIGARFPSDWRLSQITLGGNHVCGLNEDGRALCIGEAPNILGQGVEFSSISSGLHYACGLRTDGAIACWGENSLGETSSPEGPFSALSAGKRHACALDSDGAAVCWGWNKGGRAAPPPAARFIAIAAGGTHSCGIAEFSNLICWGYNPDGRSNPMEGPFSALALGDKHTCALRTDGETVCQGDDEYGQASPPPTVFSRIAAGRGWTCGIAPEGGLECWGIMSVSDHSEKFAAVSPGYDRACALTEGGAAKCWPESSPAEDPLGGAWLESPIEMFPWPAGGLAAVDRRGYVDVYPAEGGEPTLALDLTERTNCCFMEQGMLGAALDPDFDRFPFIYMYWQTRGAAPDADGFEARVSRFPVTDGGGIDADGELVILRLAQRGGVHVGGALRFGADGTLHLGLGDGAEINDSPRPSQDLSTLAGKIIRIDVRGAAEGEPYRVPPDNPFADAPGARPEIWAYGLRNPWRMSFAPNGDLIVADVGNGSREEVSIAARGANLGHPLFAGGLCVAEDRRLCGGGEDYAFPIHEYAHGGGDCAIIGGAFDSGARYIFGDYCSLRVWALERTAPDVWSATEMPEQPLSRFLAFGTDAGGAVYARRGNESKSRAWLRLCQNQDFQDWRGFQDFVSPGLRFSPETDKRAPGRTPQVLILIRYACSNKRRVGENTHWNIQRPTESRRPGRRGRDAFRLETMDSPTAYRTPRRRRAYPGPKSIMGETPPRRWIAALVSLGAVL